MGRHFFTSDSHFGHTSVALGHCERPFATIDEHDKYLIDAWNGVVTKHDTIWHLGDFAHDRADARSVQRIFGRLHGSKHLIAGNHDSSAVRDLGWSSVRDYNEIAVDGQRIVMSHYPMDAFNGMRHGAVMLFGHCHGRMPANAQRIDVGVDCPAWQFMPVDWPTIKAELDMQPKIIFTDGSDEMIVKARTPAP